MLFLRLREAVVDGGLRLVELAPRGTALTRYAEASLRYRPGAAAELARALVDPHRPVPDGVDPAALARARQLAGAGDVVVVAGRPSLAEDGHAGGRRRPGPRRRALPGRPVPPRPAARQRARRPRHGAGTGAAARAGGARDRAPMVRPCLGVGAGPARPRHRRHPRRRRRRGDRRTAGPRPRPPRGRPAGRLPRPPPGRAGARGRRAGGGGGVVAGPGPRARRRGAPGGRGPRAAPAPPPTSRAASAGSPRSWCRPDSPGPTG